MSSATKPPWSFRRRTILTIALAFIGLSLLLELIFFGYLLTTIAREERDELKVLARGLASSLRAQIPNTAPSLEWQAKIQQHLVFHAAQDQISYAIFNTAGERLHGPAQSLLSLAPYPAGGRRNYTLHWDINGLEIWRYTLRLDEPPYIILVSSLKHEEMADDALGFFAALLPVLASAAIFLGMALSRRLLEPLRRIETTVAQLREGQLSARIPLGPREDEVQQMLRELNLAFAQLEHSFRRVEQFSADAAHELRTPLTALRGHLEVGLRQERAPEEYQKILAEAIAEIASLSRLVDTLLLLAKPGAEDRRRDFQECDLRQIMEEVSEQLRPLASEQRVRLTLSAGETLPVAGDRLFLGRLVYNLLHNAIKFSPPDSTVTVSGERGPERVILSFRDQGPGIAPEFHEKIFERFYQVASSRHQGTGLGLALARWVVALHGGRLSLTSALGQGSTFTVELPLAGHPLLGP